MSTNTNGIATCANLYSLNSGAFPNWNGGLKCPTKAEITAAINSNYTLTMANTNNYSNNQLVKYSDISIGNSTEDIYITIAVTYMPIDSDDKSGRRAQLTISEVSGTDNQFIECYNMSPNTTNTYHHTLTIKKNIPYEFYLNPMSSVLVTGDYDIGGVRGSLNVKATGSPSWPEGESPTGTINIS